MNTRVFSFVFFLFVLVFGMHRAEAATYYVSNSASNGYVSGNDSNAGTSKDTARLTITSAMGLASNGDTIYVNNGTYNETLTVTKALTFLPETDYGVTLTRTSANASAAIITLNTLSSGVFTLGKFILNEDSVLAGYGLFLNNAHGSTVNVTGTRFVGGDVAHIYDSRTSGDITVDGADFQKQATGADNWKYAYATSLARVSGTVTIKNSTAEILSNNSQVSVFNFLPQSAAAGDGTMTVVMQGNTIHVENTNTTNIYVARFWNVNNFTFENNTADVYIAGSNSSNLITFEPYNNSPTYLAHTMTGVIRNNTLTNYSAGGYGLRLGTEADVANTDDKLSNIQIYGNTVSCSATSTTVHGILYGSNTGGNIYNNRVIACPIGIIMKNMDYGIVSNNIVSSSTINAIYMKGSMGTQVLNNTILQDGGQNAGQYSFWSNASDERSSSYITFSNNVIYNTATSALVMGHGTTSTNAHNYYNNYYSTQALNGSSFTNNGSSYGTVSAWQAVEPTATSTDPLFVNPTSNNFKLQALSSLIDAASSSILTSDYAGNSIYGTPDIGAYEYQPPFIVGTHNLDVTGNIRIYEDGKYRYTTATSGAMTASFSVTPVEGSYPTYGATSVRPEYLNISGITWGSTKAWTASSSIATTTVYTVGNLTAGGTYTIHIDGVNSAFVTSSSCASNVCTANGLGQIAFTYSGGYSTHTFEVAPYTAPAAETTSSSPGGGVPTLFGTNTPLIIAHIDNVPSRGASLEVNSSSGGQHNVESGLSSLVGPFSFNSESDQVSILQRYLASDGTIYPEGKITGYYGALTKKAVGRFQERYALAKKQMLFMV